MAGAFQDALADLDTAMAADPFDPWATRTALYAVAKAYVPGTPAADIRRMVVHCVDVLGLGANDAPDIPDVDLSRSLGWSVHECMETLLIDKQGNHRSFVQMGMARRLALGSDMFPGGPDAPVPFPHVPLDVADASALIAPYLGHFEAELPDDPLAHIHFVWKVLDHPNPPFDTVLRDWLAGLDARNGTSDVQAIDRAMALAQLGQEGRQHLSWKVCKDVVLPQLHDPHPLVAAGAARFLGSLYAEQGENFNGRVGMALPQLMDMLATLPQHRRYVAGGFLHGFDCDMSPFRALRADPALQGYDLEQWVLDVFAQRTHEKYLPSAQAFWFHVHEAYCFDPAFVARLIDADHLWEALTTATEMHERVEGMEPVLKRLATCDEPSIARGAQAWLARHYSGDV